MVQALPGGVIRYILKHRDQPVSAGDLMEQLGLSPSTMAGILKRLENKSLITRTTDQKDGRKVLIAPTREGMELEDYLKETALQTEGILLWGMTKAEQDEFYRLLNIAISGGVCICPDYLPFSEELAGIPYCPEKSFTVGFAYLGAPSAPMEKFLSCIKAILAECDAPQQPV